MPWSARLFISIASLAVLVIIIHFVRKKRLDERYAMLWVLSGFVMMLGPFVIPGIDRLSRAIGINYPPAFLFLMAFFALFLIVLQYSVALTRLTKQNRRLAERLAILESDLRQMGIQK